MAGLRLGYALCGDQAFLERMRCNGPPWVVSAPAQAAGIAALREQDYVARVRALEPLRKQGILLRGCANFRGLGPQWYRAAVRRPEENQCLLGAIKTVVEETRT